MKKYFGLWSILAIAFIVFFLYSFVGSKSLFGFELKSSKLSQSVIVQVDSLSVLNADTDRYTSEFIIGRFRSRYSDCWSIFRVGVDGKAAKCHFY